MILTFPCGTSAKPVAKNQNAVCCDICNLRSHIKCNNLSPPKTITQENNLASLDDESGTSVKNDCLTPDEFYQELSTISPPANLYLHVNISSLPYYFNDLKYLIEN